MAVAAGNAAVVVVVIVIIRELCACVCECMSNGWMGYNCREYIRDCFKSIVTISVLFVIRIQPKYTQRS